ncbi:MAG: outer membrane protein assembly factor BamD [Parachlamydiaceae bacterium]|nr:outer membrane protein assembly factor BamD [Parachlamydiaceae bacterium]
MKKTHFICISLLLCCLLSAQGEAAYTIKRGRLVNTEELATLSPEQHYHIGMNALEHCDWREASTQFRILALNFPNNPLGQDAQYYLGVAYYNLGDYDFANEAFSEYLKCHPDPELFEDALAYKFEIANQFRCGAKARFFGWKQMPRWASGDPLAMEIYDEVIAAMPCHEMAARALFEKAQYLSEHYEYDESVVIYQQLIRRFPKHEYIPQCYVAISKIYLMKSKLDIQNPDIYAFAQINLRRFKTDFPREEFVCEVENDLAEMKEFYADNLFQTGLFYERVCQFGASIIYYQNAIDQFPDTQVAMRCRSRVNWISTLCEPSAAALLGEAVILDDNECS